MALDFSHVDRYPELRELELRQLARTLLSPNSDLTLESLKDKIHGYTHGKLPHAEKVISMLYQLLEGDESLQEAPLPSFDKQVNGRGWDGLKKALTNSLTTGTFLDSQFYAVGLRSSTGLQTVRPIYFCSAVNVNFMSELLARESLSWILRG